jgi:hypothetical protein
MSATTVPDHPGATTSWRHGLRLALLALAVVVLLAVSFVLGRVTDGSSSVVPAVRPAVAAHATSSHPNWVPCNVGRPC